MLAIPIVRSLLLGLLPGLALRLFVLLLPLLLYPLNRAAGAVSKADVDFSVSTQYFIFQVGVAPARQSFLAPHVASPMQRAGAAPRRSLSRLHSRHLLEPAARRRRRRRVLAVFGASFVSGTLSSQPQQRQPPLHTPHPRPRRCTHPLACQVLAVFGASFISGTLFSQLQQLVDNPKQILVILGTGVPQTASFFILCERRRAAVVRAAWGPFDAGPAQVQHTHARVPSLPAQQLV